MRWESTNTDGFWTTGPLAPPVFGFSSMNALSHGVWFQWCSGERWDILMKFCNTFFLSSCFVVFMRWCWRDIAQLLPHELWDCPFLESNWHREKFDRSCSYLRSEHTGPVNPFLLKRPWRGCLLQPGFDITGPSQHLFQLLLVEQTAVFFSGNLNRRIGFQWLPWSNRLVRR